MRDTNAAVTELVADGATRALQIYSQVRAEGLRYPSATDSTQHGSHTGCAVCIASRGYAVQSIAFSEPSLTG